MKIYDKPKKGLCTCHKTNIPKVCFEICMDFWVVSTLVYSLEMLKDSSTLNFLRNDFSYLRTKLDDSFTAMICSTHMGYSKVRLVSRTDGVTYIPEKNSSCNGRRKATFKLIHLNCQRGAVLFF